MASSPITSWQIDKETMETVRDFIFLGSKITADGDCSHEIRRHLFLGRKAVKNLDNILAQIPEDAKWFTMLDLENVFFASQFIHYHNICLPGSDAAECHDLHFLNVEF